MNRTLAHPPLPSEVAPVASVIRLAKLRPFTGRFSTSSGDTFTPIFADPRSTARTSAATVTFSGDAGDTERAVLGLDLADAETDRFGLRLEAREFERHGVVAGRRLVMEYAPSPSETAVRTAPVSVEVTLMVTPGRTAPLRSATTPTMRDSVCWAPIVPVTAVRRSAATTRQDRSPDLSLTGMEKPPKVVSDFKPAHYRRRA